MPVFGPIRTALFVPGDRPDRVDKAASSGADAMIIDLEDAVALARKEEVRPLVREKILEHGANRKIIVRVNALSTPFFQGDLEEVVVKGLGGIVAPKVEDEKDIQEVSRRLLAVERRKGMEPGTVSVIPLIESARGVQNVFRIVSAKIDPPRLFTVAFGAADYTLDMGIEMTLEGTELTYPRARMAVACRAAGVEPPLDTPFMIDIKNIEAFKADAARAKKLGFQGKLVIHPNQIEPSHVIFSPSEEEVRYAKRVIQAFEEAEAGGVASIQLDGRFIDYGVVERSRRILRLSAVMKAV